MRLFPCRKNVLLEREVFLIDRGRETVLGIEYGSRFVRYSVETNEVNGACDARGHRESRVYLLCDILRAVENSIMRRTKTPPPPSSSPPYVATRKIFNKSFSSCNCGEILRRRDSVAAEHSSFEFQSAHSLILSPHRS